MTLPINKRSFIFFPDGLIFFQAEISVPRDCIYLSHVFGLGCSNSHSVRSQAVDYHLSDIFFPFHSYLHMRESMHTLTLTLQSFRVLSSQPFLGLLQISANRLFVSAEQKECGLTKDPTKQLTQVFEPTCAHARWALRHRLLSVCPSVPKYQKKSHQKKKTYLRNRLTYGQGQRSQEAKVKGQGQRSRSLLM